MGGEASPPPGGRLCKSPHLSWALFSPRGGFGAEGAGGYGVLAAASRGARCGWGLLWSTLET